MTRSKDGIAGRVRRIVSGSANALVDAVENAAPEMIMEEAIREIDGAIDDVRGELAKVIAGRHVANQRLMGENGRHEELGEKIALAVEEQRDDLAEAAIAKQIDIETQIPILEQAIAEAGEQETELNGYVAALQAKRRELHEELKRFAKAQKTSGAAAEAGAAGAASKADRAKGRADKAESTFNRVLEKQTGIGLPGGERSGYSAKQIEELDALARKNRVQERLAQLKAKDNK